MSSSSIKDVKRRIKSVESTMQITKAMELVASSKLRKAKERAISAQPYFNTLFDTMNDISKNSGGINSIYTKKEFVKGTLLIVVAGDRGLAGGFNHNVLKLAENRISELKKEEHEIFIYPIGKKAVEYFERLPYKLIMKSSHIAENISPNTTFEMAEDILAKFRIRQFDRIELIYTTFKSSLVQDAQHIAMLPVKQEESKEKLENKDERSKPKQLTLYEPSDTEVFERLIPGYVSGLLYCAIIDSFASEQAARRTAMESASDNASDMIDNLSLLYNSARQAQITQEINEIVSGSLGKN